MNRRHFLGAILATCMAPAIVRASSLMPVRARHVWEVTGTENPLYPRLFTGELGQYENVRFVIDGGVMTITEECYGRLEPGYFGDSFVLAPSYYEALRG
jgi:hypothetical protein